MPRKQKDPFADRPLHREPKTLEEANPFYVQPNQPAQIAEPVKVIAKKITTKVPKPAKEPKPVKEVPAEPEDNREPRNLIIHKSGFMRKIRYFDVDSRKFIDDASRKEKEHAEKRMKEMEEERKQKTIKELQEELNYAPLKDNTVEIVLDVEDKKSVFELLKKVKEYVDLKEYDNVRFKTSISKKSKKVKKEESESDADAE